MTSRKDEKEAARAERMRKQEETARAEARRRKIGYAVGGVLAVAAIAGVLVLFLAGGDDDGGGGDSGNASASFPARSEPLPTPPADLALESAGEKAKCTYKEHKSEGADHTEDPVTYKTVPPQSGDHNPVPADDGAYTEAPALEALVHSLEHGRIILWYPPNATDEVKADLKALFDEDPAHMIIAPLADLKDSAAASAWVQTLNCPEWSDDAINAMRAFRDQFRDQGPEFVP